MSTNPEEVIQRLNEAAADTEASNLLLRQFIQGADDEVVELDDGNIPTLRAMLEEIRNRAGSRRFNINFSVNDLTRYEMKAEPLFGAIIGEDIIVDRALSSCVFKLNTAPTADVALQINLGEYRFDVVFAAGSKVGVVQNASEDLVNVSRGAALEVSLNSYARGAAQLRLMMELMIVQIY